MHHHLVSLQSGVESGSTEPSYALKQLYRMSNNNEQWYKMEHSRQTQFTVSGPKLPYDTALDFNPSSRFNHLVFWFTTKDIHGMEKVQKKTKKDNRPYVSERHSIKNEQNKSEYINSMTQDSISSLCILYLLIRTSQTSFIKMFFWSCVNVYFMEGLHSQG